MTLVCEDCKIKRIVDGDSKIIMGVLAHKMSGVCSKCGKHTEDLHFYREAKK